MDLVLIVLGSGIEMHTHKPGPMETGCVVCWITEHTATPRLSLI